MPKSRQTLMLEFAQSYRMTGQLFFKSINKALQGQTHCDSGYMIVLEVLRQRGPLSQRAVAKELSYSDAAVSRQVAILLEKQFITVETDPSNRRLAIIALTEAGRQSIAAADSAVDTCLVKLLDSIPDARLNELVAMNKELYKSISINQEREPRDR